MDKGSNVELAHLPITAEKKEAQTAKNDVLARIEKLNERFNQILAWAAGGCLMIIILLIVANTLLRAAGTPIQGTYEIVGWLGAIVTAFSLGYTQIHKGHVEIDMVVERLNATVRRWLQVFVDLVGILFFATVTWLLVEYAMKTMKSGKLSETLLIPYHPIMFVVAAGFLGLTLALCTDLLKNVLGRETR